MSELLELNCESSVVKRVLLIREKMVTANTSSNDSPDTLIIKGSPTRSRRPDWVDWMNAWDSNWGNFSRGYIVY